MKQIKDIKNKIEQEKFYNPDFNWCASDLYRDNKLSEDFIRKFQDKVDWFWISVYQELSEDFILEFKNMLDLWEISKTQKLSDDFIRKHQNLIRWSGLANNIYISDEIKQQFKKRIETTLNQF